MSSASKAPLQRFHDAIVSQRVVELGDIADLARIPESLRDRARILPVASIGERRTQAILSSARTSERVRARMPALAPWFPSAEGSSISIKVAAAAVDAPAPRPVETCVQVTHDIEVGDAPVPADFIAASCAGAATDRPLRYDPSMRAVRALRELRAGESLPAISSSALSNVRLGQRLYVSVTTGPVRVAREVQAIQPSTSARPLFVRAADGSIFSAPSPEVSP